MDIHDILNPRPPQKEKRLIKNLDQALTEAEWVKRPLVSEDRYVTGFIFTPPGAVYNAATLFERNIPYIAVVREFIESNPRWWLYSLHSKLRTVEVQLESLEHHSKQYIDEKFTQGNLAPKAYYEFTSRGSEFKTRDKATKNAYKNKKVGRNGQILYPSPEQRIKDFHDIIENHHLLQNDSYTSLLALVKLYKINEHSNCHVAHKKSYGVSGFLYKDKTHILKVFVYMPEVWNQVEEAKGDRNV